MVAFELESLLRLLLAMFLGGMIGLERQAHGRPAGLRTHILVCLGSALVILITQSFGPNIDPGRAVAGVVTGVGFLGAGVIVKSREIVRGLTTAACIWFVAALGIIVGQGLYIIAAGSTAMALVILTFLAWFSHKIPSVSYHTVRVSATSEDPESTERHCRDLFDTLDVHVMAVTAHLAKSEHAMHLVFRLRSRTAPDPVQASRQLLSTPNVIEARWD